MRRIVLLVGLCAMVFAPGCGVRDYRVAKIGGMYYVYPPGRKVDRAPLREQRIALAGIAAQGESCRIRGEGFALEPGRKAVAVARLDSVSESGSYNQLRMREAIDEFRQELEKLESNGCLRPGDAHRVLDTLGERMTIMAGETLFLRYGFNRWRNYLDLRPGMALGVQWAFSRGPEPWGTNLASMDIGIRQYAVGPRGGGVMLARAHEAITNGKPPSERVPELHQLRQPHYRLFFLTKYVTIKGQPERSATLLGARTLAELREVTPKFLENADLACQGKLTAATPECVSVDKKISFLPEVPVSINGKPEYLTLGTDVRVLMAGRRAAGQPFTLERRFRGGYRNVAFPAGDPAAAALPLLAGDRLTFSSAPLHAKNAN